MHAIFTLLEIYIYFKIHTHMSRIICPRKERHFSYSNRRAREMREIR